jgi:hypothetical protein
MPTFGYLGQNIDALFSPAGPLALAAPRGIVQKRSFETDMEERQRIAHHEVLRRVRASADTASYRAALEAVFTRAPATAIAPPPHSSARHVAPSTPSPEDARRAALVDRLLSAASGPATDRAAEDYFAAGFDLPMDQAVLLKLLDVAAEARVRDALAALDRTLARQPAARRAILEARVRRLEDHAEERATRELAARLRRRLVGSTLLGAS